MTEPKKKKRKVKRKKRAANNLSPEARQKMSESQRVRWARYHGLLEELQ